MERADSLAFDLHKWMYMPFEVGCALVRDAEAHRNSFTVAAPTTSRTARAGSRPGRVWFSEYGIQLSRGFRALKVWMSLKEHGVREVRAPDRAERRAGASTSPGWSSAEPRARAARAGRRSTSSASASARRHSATTRSTRSTKSCCSICRRAAIAVLTSTMLNGRYAMRVANVNHRSRREDFDLLVREVLERGRRLAAAAAR